MENNLVVKMAGFEDLKMLYREEGLAFEGIDLSNINTDEGAEFMLKKFRANGLSIKDHSFIYIATGEAMNSTFDLEGDNAYRDDFHISIIRYDDCIFERNDRDFMSNLKTNLLVRWFRDICDNNEYKEYIKGRHDRTDNIQWIIDWHVRNDKK